MGLRDRRKKKQSTDSGFIGRRHYLEDFAAEWQKPSDEGPRFIVNLYGDGGIGKTRLLKQLMKMHGSGVMICWLDANFDPLNDPTSLLHLLIEKTKLDDQPVTFKKAAKLLAK